MSGPVYKRLVPEPDRDFVILVIEKGLLARGATTVGASGTSGISDARQAATGARSAQVPEPLLDRGRRGSLRRPGHQFDLLVATDERHHHHVVEALRVSADAYVGVDDGFAVDLTLPAERLVDGVEYGRTVTSASWP